MNRVDKLRRESNENDTRIAIETDSTNSINYDGGNKVAVESEYKSESNQLQRQIAEEKAAAKIFPLNLISSRFKAKDPNALKGKSISCSYLCMYVTYVCKPR